MLVIRGELLKRYPTAVDLRPPRGVGSARPTARSTRRRQRKLADLTPAEEVAAARARCKTPLYEAKVEPDIYFFGFDLTADGARGGATVHRRRGPRLVLRDQGAPGRAALRPRPAAATRARPIARSGTTWRGRTCVDATTPPSSCRSAQRRVAVAQRRRRPGRSRATSTTRTRRTAGGADTNAAELAYILTRLPVLMAVHAAEMLTKDGG